MSSVRQRKKADATSAPADEHARAFDAIKQKDAAKKAKHVPSWKDWIPIACLAVRGGGCVQVSP